MHGEELQARSFRAEKLTQREWYLPQSKILVIDQWATPGLATILKNATWNN